MPGPSASASLPEIAKQFDLLADQFGQLRFDASTQAVADEIQERADHIYLSGVNWVVRLLDTIGKAQGDWPEWLTQVHHCRTVMYSDWSHGRLPDPTAERARVERGMVIWDIWIRRWVLDAVPEHEREPVRINQLRKVREPNAAERRAFARYERDSDRWIKSREAALTAGRSFDTPPPQMPPKPWWQYGPNNDHITSLDRWASIQRTRARDAVQTCRVIADFIRAGLLSAEHIGASAKTVTTRTVPPPTIPVWDGESTTLRFGSELKAFKAHAKRVWAVLEAFQVAGWPEGIAWPRTAGSIKYTIRSLNEAIPFLHFAGTAKDGVKWSPRKTVRRPTVAKRA